MIRLTLISNIKANKLRHCLRSVIVHPSDVLTSHFTSKFNDYIVYFPCFSVKTDAASPYNFGKRKLANQTPCNLTVIYITTTMSQ